MPEANTADAAWDDTAEQEPMKGDPAEQQNRAAKNESAQDRAARKEKERVARQEASDRRAMDAMQQKPRNADEEAKARAYFEAQRREVEAQQQQQDATKNVVVADKDEFKDSGRKVGLVDAPIVSVGKESGTRSEAADDYEAPEIFDNANYYLNFKGVQNDHFYPFADMKPGQGFFVPTRKGKTTDHLVMTLHKAVDAFIEQTSTTEKDKNGDDIWETITTIPKKRNTDGTIQLDGAGNPIVGANHTHRPKRLHASTFMVLPVIAGDEIAEGRTSDTDGALVIRVT